MEGKGEGKYYELPQKCEFFKIKFGATEITLMMYDANNFVLQIYFLVQLPVLSLQWTSTNSPLPPSVLVLYDLT